MGGAIYNDFTQFTTLRAEAANNPNAALEEVAAQFESIFLQQMLKSMRDATVKSDLFDSSQMDTYQGMADQQLALKLAEGGGIGLARMMVEQMQSKGYVGDESETREAVTSESAIETDIQGFRLRAADAYENGSKD
jgi:flagellar protein FlgJ